jgi:hypothetical protein
MVGHYKKLLSTWYSILTSPLLIFFTSDNCYGKSVDIDCIKEAVISMQKYCGHFNEASIKYAKYIRDCIYSTDFKRNFKKYAL